MSVPDENKHSDSQVRIHDTSSFETNCQRATQSNPTSDFSSLKSRQECPECQEPPEAPFDTCLLFYKNSRSPWNRCTVSRLEPFFSKVVHASIRHYSIFFVLESNLHDYGDFRRTTDRLVSRRRSPSPAKLPPWIFHSHLFVCFRFSCFLPSFYPRCFYTTVPLRSKISPRSYERPNLWPTVEKSARGTCPPLRTRPSSFSGTRCSSSFRRSSFSATKCP